MITYSGQSVFPWYDDRYTGESPDLSDIAIGLGRQSRFAGQTVFFYNVLCHVLVASKLVGPTYRIHVLLHDAAEAIMGDVPTTWKPDVFSTLEQDIIDILYDSIGLPHPSAVDLAAVKQADMACLAGEAHALGHAKAEKYWPRESMNSLAFEAEEKTIEMLQLGRNRSFINPNESVYAFLGAVWEAMEYNYDHRNDYAVS